jgi:hypothetical protein
MIDGELNAIGAGMGVRLDDVRTIGRDGGFSIPISASACLSDDRRNSGVLGKPERIFS